MNGSIESRAGALFPWRVMRTWPLAAAWNSRPAIIPASATDTKPPYPMTRPNHLASLSSDASLSWAPAIASLSVSSLFAYASSELESSRPPPSAATTPDHHRAIVVPRRERTRREPRCSCSDGPLQALPWLRRVANAGAIGARRHDHRENRESGVSRIIPVIPRNRGDHPADPGVSEGSSQ